MVLTCFILEFSFWNLAISCLNLTVLFNHLTFFSSAVWLTLILVLAEVVWLEAAVFGLGSSLLLLLLFKLILHNELKRGKKVWFHFQKRKLHFREALDPPLCAPRKSTDLKFSKNYLREISRIMLSFKEILLNNAWVITFEKNSKSLLKWFDYTLWLAQNLFL